ncbi:MAG TPA: 6-phosphofructokinase [Anaerolineae bacterium]|nr:6-phosphofructokinase [Anaerolineae bacterium]HQH38308.1 6-phosphofructokinase [Anaerolineae bacterium]
MRKMAVLTSGGDGPALNACIRAVTRDALRHDVQVYGVRWGYKGMVNGEIDELTGRDVGGIMARGGTFLGTARCPEFKEIRVRRTALRQMNQLGIEGLIVIGGNGSLTGALALHEMGFPTYGIPASIDNDINGTDMAIGVDTTLNTILDAIDRIKDTAASHQRAFLVEVMGRDCGYLALASGLAGGAELILVPEHAGPPLEEIAATVVEAYIKGKSHCILVIAEGWKPGTQAVAEYLSARKEELGFDVRVTVLGHVQRGGRPSAYDRLLATRMGAFAADHLIEGESGQMVAMHGNVLESFPLAEAVKTLKPLNLTLLGLSEVMD